MPGPISTLASVLLVAAGTTMSDSGTGTPSSPATVHGFVMKDIDGKEIALSRYRGKVLLIVNVASQCGLTPQYKGLQALYDRYKGRGFAVLGFPANNFGGQEPGTEEEIRTFCETTYGVSFPLFSKISVKGNDQHPLYRFLTSAETNPEHAGEVQWNFQKYLIGRDGTILMKFTPKTDPLSEEVTKAVEQALNN